MATVKVSHDFPWPLKQLDVKKIGDKIGVDWSQIPLTEFEAGFKEEMEHGSHDPQTDVTHDDPIATGKIALAHLKEDPHYYSKLERTMKMISAKAVQSRARKMVAAKGLVDNIGSVVAVRNKLAKAKKFVDAGNQLSKEQIGSLSSAFLGLQSIADQIGQAGASVGDSDAKYYTQAWLRSINESRDRLASMLSEKKAGKYQSVMLNSLISNCNYLIDDLKRYTKNFMGTRRHNR